MKPLWEFNFNDSSDFIETFDELPLWSAQFGLMLLQHVELKDYRTVLDIGSGAGFPLFELAERLGNKTKCIGLDPWKNANERSRKKIRNYEVENVEIIEGSAEKIPFDKESIDLIVSNLGINNFENPVSVFLECHRVLKPGSKLVITTNLNGHWHEFYRVFEQTLEQLNEMEILEKLKKEEVHRGTLETTVNLFTNAGFKMTKTIENKFEMRFLDGSAFLNHHFIKVGWLGSWLNIVPVDKRETIFKQLAGDLNKHSRNHDGLTLTVPMAYIEGMKTK